MFILETNVISAARRPERNAKLTSWIKGQNDDDLYLSVITIGEISRGIRKQEKADPDFAEDLSIWLNRTVTLFDDRILPFSSEDARIWGVLSADIGHPGADLMIAATALSHGAVVVTGNVSDFEPTGVQTFDPF